MQNSAARVQPTVLTIFGAAGDLTWRKIVPALFRLSRKDNLPKPFAVLGVDRVAQTDEAYRRHLRKQLAKTASSRSIPADGWKAFARQIGYLRADFTDQAAYTALAKRITALEQEWRSKVNRIFYLAIPPQLIASITTALGSAGLARDRQHARIVVEKPFGSDLESAVRLNGLLTDAFHESQIFRIDHYLGKETVQNILAFRFANPLFEPIWDRRYVDHVAITVAEDAGVEHRGGYYDHAGALRDMVQNHLLQLLCLVAMEPPVAYRADEIRNKKVDVLHAIRPIARETVHTVAARGQYGSGWVQGKHVLAYREEPMVAQDSNTETFAALKLFVDNWRWQDVPFYLRTGKRLAAHLSEVSVRFRAVPHEPFPPEAALDWQGARLVVCIQPSEGIVLKFQAKQPGPEMRLRPVDMRFSYRQAFKTPSPDAYETLLRDVMRGDATLFMRADQVEAAWSILMPVLEVWGTTPAPAFPNYMAGTWGPEAAEALIARDGRSWLLPTLLADPGE